jgi:molybdopterin converting factor small subunit
MSDNAVMKIKVLFFAQLREAAGVSEQMVDLADPIAIGKFIKDFLDQPRFTTYKDLPFRYAMNDEFVSADKIIEEHESFYFTFIQLFF